jgi:hypothetical protein
LYFLFSSDHTTFLVKRVGGSFYIAVFLSFCRGVEMADEAVEKVEKTIKTTIKLADKLWRDVKVYAAKKGLKLLKLLRRHCESM